MKLFLISQEENTGYDTFDSAVVAAMTEEDAQKVIPYNPNCFDGTEKRTWGGTWAWNKDAVEVKLIGTTNKYKAGTVICASFNAG